MQNAVKEIREITQDEKKFKAEVSQTIKSEMDRTVADAKAYAFEQSRRNAAGNKRTAKNYGKGNRTRVRGYETRPRHPQFIDGILKIRKTQVDSDKRI